MAGQINLADIPLETRKKLGLKKPRRAPSLSKHEIRTLAFRVMNVIADLTPTERRRVLAHALKLNEV